MTILSYALYAIIGIMLGMLVTILMTASSDTEDEHADNVGVDSYRPEDNDENI